MRLVKVMYNDKLVYKVAILVYWVLFYEKKKEALNRMFFLKT